MDDEAASLFADSFEDSKLGKVPKGWRVLTWGDIATLEYGKSLRSYQAATGRFRVYGTNGPIGWHTEALCPQAGVIIGRKGAYRGIHYSPFPFFVIDTAFYLKERVPFDMKWAYFELLLVDINGMDSGSAIPSTSRDDFYNLPVCLPPSELLNRFGTQVRTWERMQIANSSQSETLGHLRDSLLPKLLSGELRIKDAERFVGD